MSWTRTPGGRTNSRCSDKARQLIRASTQRAGQQASVSIEEKNGGGANEFAALKQCSPNSRIRSCGSAAPKAELLEGNGEEAALQRIEGSIV